MPEDRMLALPDRVALALRSWLPTAAATPALPPFVLVHGLASNLRMWDGVAAELADQGAAVYAVDLRGHGRSDKPDAGYGTREVLGDLEAVAAALGLARAVWAGQSWGGNLVVELGARRPDLTAAVVAVDGGFIDLQEQFPDWSQCARQLAPPRLAGMPAATLEAGVRAAHPSWPETGIDGVLGCFEVRADGTAAPWLSFDHHMLVLHGLWEHHPRPALAALVSAGTPVLLLAAESADSGDARTHAKRAAVDALAAEFPSVTVCRMAGEHDLHAQHPAAVAAALMAVATGTEMCADG